MVDEGINETTDQLQPVVFQIRPDTAKLLILNFLFDLSPGGKHWKMKYTSRSSMYSVMKYLHSNYVTG
jgi:hypothetical protein